MSKAKSIESYHYFVDSIFPLMGHYEALSKAANSGMDLAYLTAYQDCLETFTGLSDKVSTEVVIIMMKERLEELSKRKKIPFPDRGEKK